MYAPISPCCRGLTLLKKSIYRLLDQFLPVIQYLYHSHYWTQFSVNVVSLPQSTPLTASHYPSPISPLSLWRECRHQHHHPHPPQHPTLTSISESHPHHHHHPTSTTPPLSLFGGSVTSGKDSILAFIR